MKGLIIDTFAVKRLIYIVLVVTLLLLPTIFGVCCIKDAGIGLLGCALFFVLPFILLFLYSAKSVVTHSIMTILVFLINGLEVLVVRLYGDYVTAGSIISTFATDTNETGEFARYNAWVLGWLVPIIIIVLGIFLLRKYAPRIDRKRFWMMEGAGIVIAILLSVFSRYSVLRCPPYNFMTQSYNSVCWKIARDRGLCQGEKNARGFERKEIIREHEKEIYFLIIGESCRYANCSFDGQYTRNTTPLLKDAVDNQQIVSFSNYYSTATMTIFAVPQLLTPGTAKQFEQVYSEPTVMRYFSEAGFKTYGVTSSTIFKNEDYLARDLDEVFAFPYDVDMKTKPLPTILHGDMDVAYVIDSLCEVNDKLFFVVKLHGQHTYYTNFTQDCNVYKPNLYDMSVADKKRKDLFVNAYDNTLRHTDKVINDILQSVERTGAVAAGFYVSDHGEQLSANGGGHGIDCNPPKVEYHVPCLFYSSASYQEAYPEVCAQAKAHQKDGICADNIYHSILSMAHLTVLDSKHYDEQYSVFSPQFRLHERYLLLSDYVNYIKLK